MICVGLIIVLLLLLCAAAAFSIRSALLSRRESRNGEAGDCADWYAMAYTDGLTGLMNRNAYMRKTHDLQQQGKDNVWLLLFDIDHLKTINDTRGHISGDDMLISAANRLKEVFAADCHSVYRIGGDEFLVVSEDTEEPQVVALLLQLGEMERKCGQFRLSKGYAKVNAGETDAFRHAFVYADQMLYADKNSKRTEDAPSDTASD